MKFLMPTASRKRLEELLEYLGARAEDFKKCFDIESEWCMKYADLVLRGMKKRDLEYAEGHHVVPASFYGKRGCSKVDEGNLTVLTYGEHVWAHYCLVWCATGKMRVKMVRAFLIMYSIVLAGSRPLMPSEAELLDAIPEMELRRIQTMEPRWAKVEAEGRTHKCDDPKQYRKEQGKAYYEANKEKVSRRKKAYREANKEKIAEQSKAYYEANKEKVSRRKKAYYEANRKIHAEKMKAWREANKERVAEQVKAWREANKERVVERNKAWREANKEKIAKQGKAYYEANKEKIAERGKAYREGIKEKIAERGKAYREANKEKIAKRNKAWRETNKERIAEQKKAYYEAKKAAGYKYHKDPVTGKQGWIFIGLPETPKSSEVA